MCASVVPTMAVARFERDWRAATRANPPGPLPRVRDYLPDGPDELRFEVFVAIAFSERALCLRDGLNPRDRAATADPEFGRLFASDPSRMRAYERSARRNPSRWT
jgi:hypothetical protein